MNFFVYNIYLDFHEYDLCKHDLYREHLHIYIYIFILLVNEAHYLHITVLTADWLSLFPEKEASTWVDQSKAWNSGGGTFPL